MYYKSPKDSLQGKQKNVYSSLLQNMFKGNLTFLFYVLRASMKIIRPS